MSRDAKGGSLKHRRNHRIKFIGLGLIVLLSLALFVRVVIAREIEEINQLRATIDAAEGKPNSPARIQALQKIVSLGISQANVNLSGTNLSRAI
ncbi:hypothetical protein [Brasilonema octagenarum]|uniref:Uncharacterized protein n=1 Tax=Brasilonema octagenarum UFV-OR1 TaxID=417115 RepID=A0ABX1M8Q7_9CYAN|nr:hypothetical protein [Brasilonema octagenarum]NMF62382.1 hypothetical protein [Brasilonema octagenarum UFV-OR1]